MTGAEFAAAIDGLIAAGKTRAYRPDEEIGPSQPETLRELLADESPPVWMNPGSWASECVWRLFGGQRRQNRSRRPVPPAKLPPEILRPVGPGIPGEDARRMRPVLKAMHEWLTREGVEVDIDHRLDQEGWPVWMEFARILKERTGYDAGQLFPQEENEYQSCDWDMWDYAALPMFSRDDWVNAGSLLEFLDSIQERLAGLSGGCLQLPEGANLVIMNSSELELGASGCWTAREYRGRAENVLTTLVETGQWDLLPEAWARAIGMMARSETPLELWDFGDENRPSIETAADLDRLMVKARDLHQLHEAIDPLLNECNKEPNQFWVTFTRALNDLAISQPALAKRPADQAAVAVAVAVQTNA